MRAGGLQAMSDGTMDEGIVHATRNRLVIGSFARSCMAKRRSKWVSCGTWESHSKSSFSAIGKYVIVSPRSVSADG